MRTVKFNTNVLVRIRVLISLFLIINVLSEFNVIGKESDLFYTGKSTNAAETNPANITGIANKDHQEVTRYTPGIEKSFLIAGLLFILKAIKLVCICTFFLLLCCLLSSLIPLLLPLFLFSLFLTFLLIRIITLNRPTLPPATVTPVVPGDDDDDDFEVITNRSVE